ncbi:MAG TPA: 50S ribosomal protein L35 [bacterium]|nr:50S ribosomal protein L35 [bacterium]
MPKMKSNRSAAKRFRKTATGKIRRKKAFKNHILTHKSSKRKRHLKKGESLEKGDEKRVKVILPYL